MQSTTLTRAVVVAGGALVFSAVLCAQETPSVAPETGAVKAEVAAPPQPTDDPATMPEHAVSQIRIVRVSEVRGIVQMDRNTGRGYEAAFANIPVVAGTRLRTGEGVAEVEFEDNSSLRLAPNSEVRFGQLGRMATGGTETTVDVVKGLIFVSLEKTKGNEFNLVDGTARVVLMPGAHLRLNAQTAQAQLAVFEGVAELQVGGTGTTVGKKQTVILSPSAQTVSSVTQGTEEGDWDQWDKQEKDYHKQKASFAGTGGSGLYGSNDLGYYGSFVDMPGCGSMWRPYFASAAWDPFASGVWTWYPSAGYSWVSPYPWGWLPFHSGSWASCGSAGWGWRPGGSWYGLNNMTAMRIAGRLPHPVPPSPGRNAGTTLVPVNMKQLTMSGPSNTGGGFAFRRDSAGIGVPRATFGNLHGVADHVARSGETMRGMPTAGLAPTPTNAHQMGGGMNTARAGAMPNATRSAAGSPNGGARSMSGSSNGASMSSPSAGGGMRSGGSMPSGGAPAAGGSHK